MTDLRALFDDPNTLQLELQKLGADREPDGSYVLELRAPFGRPPVTKLADGRRGLMTSVYYRRRGVPVPLVPEPAVDVNVPPGELLGHCRLCTKPHPITEDEVQA